MICFLYIHKKGCNSNHFSGKKLNHNFVLKIKQKIFNQEIYLEYISSSIESLIISLVILHSFV